MPFHAGLSSHNPPVHSRVMASGPSTRDRRGWIVVALVNRLRDAVGDAPEPISDRCLYCRLNNVSGWYGYWKSPSQV